MPHPTEADPFPPEKPKRVLHHLAFAVEHRRYDDLQERCREAGYNVRLGIHPVLQGVRTFYVDDPEGNEVEIIAKDPGGKRKFAEG
jgi:catechol-2,3-dioxygenase